MEGQKLKKEQNDDLRALKYQKSKKEVQIAQMDTEVEHGKERIEGGDQRTAEGEQASGVQPQAETPEAPAVIDHDSEIERMRSLDDPPEREI